MGSKHMQQHAGMVWSEEEEDMSVCVCELA